MPVPLNIFRSNRLIGTLLTIVALHAIAQSSPLMAQGSDGNVTIDISSLDVGSTFQGAQLGRTIRRILVVRIEDTDALEDDYFFQVELYDPDGDFVARHASPTAKPRGFADGRYLFPERSAVMFPEEIVGTYDYAIHNTAGARTRREAVFSFSDMFTYLGADTEPEEPAFHADLWIFQKDTGSGVKELAHTRMYFALNQDS